MQINSGPFKHFYKFNVRFKDNNGIVYGSNQPFFRAKLPVKIKGFNKTTFPYVGGYYYIPYNTDMNQIDLRRLLYALTYQLVPTSGNTEIFEQQMNQIPVPNDYCPGLEPCPFAWCRCQNGELIYGNTIIDDVPWYVTMYKWSILGVMALIMLIWTIKSYTYN